MAYDIDRIFRGVSRRVTALKDWFSGFEYIGDSGRVPRSLKVCLLDECRECGKTPGSRHQPRIIYLLPAVRHAVGGVKVSFQQCSAIARSGSPSFVFLAELPEFETTWFQSDVTTLRSGHIDPRTDFLVFTEMWAAIASEFCLPAGIRYAIFVQNGYLTDATAGYPRAALREAYQHASMVLSISEDATAITQLAFPSVPPERIMRIMLSVPPIFAPSPKERLITYMPRKLPVHSQLLNFFLESSNLPAGWRIEPIQNLDESGVAELLGRSSVFLSFSDLEGFGLPPFEAALAGNVVVGYTGLAGKEFFRAPVFREVAYGDFPTYVQLVREAIREVDGGLLADPAFIAQRQALAARYSAETEQRSLAAFVARVRQVMVSPASLGTPSPARAKLAATVSTD